MDDANIENKNDQVFTFAPGEGQHPYFVVRDHLTNMKDLFEFIIVTL